VTIEDTAELQASRITVGSFETRPINIEARASITQSAILVINALLYASGPHHHRRVPRPEAPTDAGE